MIAAVDPGTEKTGIAVLKENGRLMMKEIISTVNLERPILNILEEYDISVIVLGNGTNHKKVRARIQNLIDVSGHPMPIELVDEKYTTEMGEKLYWKENPPKGLRRLLPVGFQTVPVPIDDYVAWIIGNIYLGIVKAEDVGHKKV